jgi:hypothetical protein
MHATTNPLVAAYRLKGAFSMRNASRHIGGTDLVDLIYELEHPIQPTQSAPVVTGGSRKPRAGITVREAMIAAAPYGFPIDVERKIVDNGVFDVYVRCGPRMTRVRVDASDGKVLGTVPHAPSAQTRGDAIAPSSRD